MIDNIGRFLLTIIENIGALLLTIIENEPTLRVLATFDDQVASRRALRMRVIAEEAGARLQVSSTAVALRRNALNRKL